MQRGGGGEEPGYREVGGDVCACVCVGGIIGRVWEGRRRAKRGWGREMMQPAILA